MDCIRTEFQSLDDKSLIDIEEERPYKEEISKKKNESLTVSKTNQNYVNLEESKLPEQSASCDKKPTSIPEDVRLKLQKVIEKYPSGMYAADFPLLYEEVNHVKFDLYDLGYISLADFVDHVPDILKRKRIAGSKTDWLIFPENLKKKTIVKDILSKDSDQRIFYIERTIWNIRKMLADYPDGITLQDFLHVYSINNEEPLYVRELGFSDVESFLLSVYERVPLRVDTNGHCKTLHLIPDGDISRRQHLLGIVGDELLYVDYGTKQVVSSALLRYIRQEFVNLPVQALQSRLAFIKPKEMTWPMPYVQKKLFSLCKDRQLMAKIVERR
ncbi:uncharacterized protein LOC118192583, partial [Stegodyphus dumicola]|uniref:uncharacterized protein LOC118192583 n=1 Tax=Stegodyphus dumicola TaxID=202533 RepID=UPI0015ADECB4